MLTELYIENIAVIQKATIPFKQGLNVFTGETGAGKTILISAIDAVLGERTSRDIIRSGEDKAVVSALFENLSSETIKKMEEMGFEAPDASALIFREMTTAGRNTCRVNGLPANVSMLKELAQNLIHIHGQRDTGQLVSPDTHLQLVDSFGELEGEISVYERKFLELEKKKHLLSSLAMDESQKAQRLDMLGFQIKEIESAELNNPLEEEELLSQRQIMNSSERIRQGLSQALNAYEGGETPGVSELMGQISGGLQQAATYMTSLEQLSKRSEEVVYELGDIVSDLEHSFNELDFDPSELDVIENRLNVFYNLKRKYGDSITEILEFYNNAVEEYESISLSDKTRDQLLQDIERLKKEAQELAGKLTRKRSIACKKFMEQVERELAFLDMPDVKLSVAHQTIPLNRLGCDLLEFQIITNVGEQPKPLGKIASGGELARIMLSIKNVMADKDNIDTLIFDEIDTGVSGSAAGKIGRKLSEVSQSRQVICVTHLAQVAAYANNHLYIHKLIKDNRTYTLVDELDKEDAVRELARITSGEVITAAALESARELIHRAQSLNQ